MAEWNTEQSRAEQSNLPTFQHWSSWFVWVLMLYIELLVESKTRHKDWRGEDRTHLKHLLFSKFSPYFCTVQSFSHYLLLKLTLLSTLGWKIFLMFLTKIFFKKSPLAETFITCWKIINTLVYISHFAITGISSDWLWPHIFITGEKPSELNNKWTILIAGNGDNLGSICYSGESRHGMVKTTQQPPPSPQTTRHLQTDSSHRQYYF